MGIVEQYLLQLNIEKRRLRRAAAILTVLSLLVAVGVSWNLRMTGITLVNDACCGYTEHLHTEECLAQNTVSDHDEEGLPHTPADECCQNDYQCGYDEHLHSLACYSNPKADVETLLDWQQAFETYPYSGDLREDLVGIAKTQVGYTESALNFEADNDGERHGYTRYGAWYGAPYNEWSAMFVSFCLNYAEADLTQYPINSGADTMAGLWEELGRYTPAGPYVPVSGDLVFFEDNTVGIVAEVQNASLSVIIGDAEDAVGTILLPISDARIVGWGIVDAPAEADESFEKKGEQSEGELSENELAEDELPEDELPEDQQLEAPAIDEAFTMEDLTEEELYDISHGPAVYILSGVLPQEPEMPPAFFTLSASRTIIDLSAYLKGNEGTYFFTLLDLENVELPKDDNNNYIVQANQPYKLYISFSSPNGYSPGTYQYQVPNGLMVEGGSGEIELKNNTIVGTWEVTDTGLITFVFNEKMNSLTETTISATLGIKFNEQPGPLDFDGKITVTVEKPPEQQDPTSMLKWGRQGDVTKGEDPSKIYWSVQITGNKDSQIPGSILSDQILSGLWSKDHHYTESDIAGGLTFGVSEPNPVTGAQMSWHAWTVTPDDPRLVWSEDGWSYKMPQTATCQWCGEVILGNENWIYTVNYTSTPYRESTAGTYGYENTASIDGQHAYGWADMTHGELHGEIKKSGIFTSDANGGSFVWEVQALIPGMQQGQKADYHWYIMDYMYLLDKEADRVDYTENHAHLSTVTAEFNGTAVHVPSIEHATANDRFAWHNAWTAVENGIGYGKEINLLCRCNCTESSCMYWNQSSGCGTKYWIDGAERPSDFCQCWAVEEAVNFTFVYATDALPLIEEYSAFSYQVQNIAELYYKPDGYSQIGALVDTDQAKVSIPSVFEKKLTQDFNGYTAHYRITVNEAKAVLTNGTPLTIQDEMTDTLAFISGSLVITAEDANGNTSTLQQDKHYTVSYDGREGQTDTNGNPIHLLEIVILHPQPVKYILDYDTTLIMPEHITGAVKYRNSANINLWGKSLSSDTIEKTHAAINLAASSFAVEVYKTCAMTQNPLAGAVFGIYNANGGLITSTTTGDDGYILFKTDLEKGIILREHQLYYIEETQVPAGYQPDDTRHRFVFCNSAADSCTTCQALLGSTNGIRIPAERIEQLHIANQPIMTELPATGGIGMTLHILCGAPLVAAPLVYGLSLRRRHERRFKQ